MSGACAALILAGSRGARDPVAAAAGVPAKAFAPVAGRPMLARVIEALAGCPEIGDIVVSIEPGMPDLPETSRAVRRLDAEPSPAASALAGTEALSAPLLVTTADNPLLTPKTISAFLDGARAAEVDVCAALAPRAAVERAGNPGRRTYLRFSDGAFSGCNLFHISTEAGMGAIRFWRALEADRKRPWRMASKIGPGVLARYAAGRLSTAQVAAAISGRAGCRAAIVRLDEPLAAHDVDKPEDLAFAERVLSA
ncbi:MAG: NTP transferase domain-containing protein [Pseudomonadota bacterium]